MQKKTEKQIQEEIRRRVLKHDEAIHQKQDLELDREANREALAALTSLSRQNVDQIAKQVRDEFATKRRRKRKFIFIGIIFILITIGYIISNGPDSSRKREPDLNQARNIDFAELFTNNNNKWPTGETCEFKRKFKDGRYIYTNGRQGYCTWNKIPVKFPSNYEIELTSTWLKGKYDEYGFMLINESKKPSFHNIQINADGSARVSTMVNNKWASSANWIEDKAHQGDGETANTQRLKVKNGNYEKVVCDKIHDRGVGCS